MNPIWKCKLIRFHSAPCSDSRHVMVFYEVSYYYCYHYVTELKNWSYRFVFELYNTGGRLEPVRWWKQSYGRLIVSCIYDLPNGAILMTLNDPNPDFKGHLLSQKRYKIETYLNMPCSTA